MRGVRAGGDARSRAEVGACADRAGLGTGQAQRACSKRDGSDACVPHVELSINWACMPAPCNLGSFINVAGRKHWIEK